MVGKMVEIMVEKMENKEWQKMEGRRGWGLVSSLEIQK
jgi:hypothetical protein